MKKIYYHGTIHTMEDANPCAEALCIEDGIILKVGTKEEVFALCTPEDEVIDLQGKTMFPGFIDGHSHFIGVANSLAQCDLSNAKSFADIVQTMKNFLKENDIQPGEWVCGIAYDHNFLVEKKHPDKHLLDQISTSNPIIISHISSHMGSVNTLALKEMNINASTKDPHGGKFYREEGSLEPNGHMEENAFFQSQSMVPMIRMETMMKLICKAQQIYASYGITTVQDGMVAKPLFQLLQYAAAQKLLQLDVIGYIDLNQWRCLTKENKAYVNQYVDHFKIGGYKIFLDGSPQGRTAWMSTPYLGAEKAYYGYPVLEDQKLYELIQEALEDHLQLLAHCNGDAAAEQYITQFEAVHAKHPELPTKRPVMIHAQLVRRDQLERMPALEMNPSFFIAHTYFWGDIHIENFGEARASLISPAKDAQELGLHYTFHQDSPVLPPDMMRTIWCAVNRETRSGASIGKQEGISAHDAMKAITVHGAYQYFEEDRKGTIKEGKLADLVILDNDPLTCDPKMLCDINILETIKEGKTIFKR